MKPSNIIANIIKLVIAIPFLVLFVLIGHLLGQGMFIFTIIMASLLFLILLLRVFGK